MLGLFFFLSYFYLCISFCFSMIFLLICRIKGKNRASTNTQYKPASLKALTRLGRQTPFSQREIMPEFFRPKILATSFCFNPIAFLYFLRLFGIFLNSTFFIPSLINSYTFQNMQRVKSKQDIKNCLLKQFCGLTVEKVGIKEKNHLKDCKKFV